MHTVQLVCMSISQLRNPRAAIRGKAEKCKEGSNQPAAAMISKVRFGPKATMRLLFRQLEAINSPLRIISGGTKMPIATNLEVITLFVTDIVAAKAFYLKVFAPEIAYEDVAQAGFLWPSPLTPKTAPPPVFAASNNRDRGNAGNNAQTPNHSRAQDECRLRAEIA